MKIDIERSKLESLAKEPGWNVLKERMEKMKRVVGQSESMPENGFNAIKSDIYRIAVIKTINTIISTVEKNL